MQEIQILSNSYLKTYKSSTVKIKLVDILLSDKYKRSNSFKYKSKKLSITKSADGKLLLKIHKSVFYSTNLDYTYKKGDYYFLIVDLLQKIPTKLLQISMFKREFEFVEFIEFKEIKEFQDLSFDQKYLKSFRVDASDLDRLENLDFQKLETEEILEILQDIKYFLGKQDLTDVVEDTSMGKWVFIRASDVEDRQVMILGNRNGILKFCIE